MQWPVLHQCLRYLLFLCRHLGRRPRFLLLLFRRLLCMLLRSFTSIIFTFRCQVLRPCRSEVPHPLRRPAEAARALETLRRGHRRICRLAQARTDGHRPVSLPLVLSILIPSFPVRTRSAATCVTFRVTPHSDRRARSGMREQANNGLTPRGSAPASTTGEHLTRLCTFSSSVLF